MNVFKITQDKHIDHEIGAYSNFVSSIKYSSPVHTHDFFEFFVITSGKCEHIVNDVNRILSKGDLVFMRPCDIHYYEGIDKEDCQFINIAFDDSVMNKARQYIGEEIFDKKILSTSLPPLINLSAAQLVELESQFNDIMFFGNFDKLQARMHMKCMLINVLSRFFQEDASRNETEFPLWLDSLLKQMQHEKNFTIGLKRLYELSGRSIGHINRVFKNSLNTTPTDYINELRLQFAKNLILTTELSIIEISMEAGFNNLSHFYHLFKKKFNDSPQNLRISRES